MKIPGLRWYLCILLFIATGLCFLDRQVLSVVAPTLCTEFQMDNKTYGYTTTAFLVSYALMFLLGGRLVDVLGTRLGLGLSVAFWSLASAIHGIIATPWHLGIARFCLGVGEGACFPGAAKAVAEWFPRKERALAVGIAIGGASLGGVVAPPFTVWCVQTFGWRETFFCTGLFGAIWVAFWFFLYYLPKKSPWLTEKERLHILDVKDNQSEESLSQSVLSPISTHDAKPNTTANSKSGVKSDSQVLCRTDSISDSTTIDGEDQTIEQSIASDLTDTVDTTSPQILSVVTESDITSSKTKITDTKRAQKTDLKNNLYAEVDSERTMTDAIASDLTDTDISIYIPTIPDSSDTRSGTAGDISSSSTESSRLKESSNVRKKSPEFWSLFLRRDVIGFSLARLLFDPVFYLYMFWIPKYLTQERGLSFSEAGSLAWIPFLALGISNIIGGWFSDRLVRSGLPAITARKGVMALAAVATMSSGLAAFSPSVNFAIMMMSILMFAHGFWITNYVTLISDRFEGSLVGSVMGISGMVGSLGAMFTNTATGYISDHYSFFPIWIVSGCLYPMAMIVIFFMVRGEKKEEL